MAIPRNLANLANQLNGDGEVPKLEVGDSKVEVTDTGSNGTIVFNTDGSERMRITSAGNVGIGVTPVASYVTSGYRALQIGASHFWSAPVGNEALEVGFNAYLNTSASYIYMYNGFATQYVQVDGTHRWKTAPSGTAGGSVTFTERARITSGGELLVGKTASDTTTAGCRFLGNGVGVFVVSGDEVLIVNRLTDDGVLVSFRQASTTEGTISVSGTTVSYNGGHLSRWAQLTTPKDDTPLFKGTVMSNLDEMNVYIAPTTYWTEEDELPDGVNVGDVKEAEHEVENEQLNKVKVSDVEGDANVAGVFVNWTYDEAHQVDEINMAMTGDMIIRISQGVTVSRGDLLMSAGNGTAKPQGDDIVRSKTIAKVTSTHVTCTYDDGSYCVPCVLMAC